MKQFIYAIWQLKKCFFLCFLSIETISASKTSSLLIQSRDLSAHPQSVATSFHKMNVVAVDIGSCKTWCQKECRECWNLGFSDHFSWALARRRATSRILRFLQLPEGRRCCDECCDTYLHMVLSLEIFAEFDGGVSDFQRNSAVRGGFLWNWKCWDVSCRTKCWWWAGNRSIRPSCCVKFPNESARCRDCYARSVLAIQWRRLW